EIVVFEQYFHPGYDRIGFSFFIRAFFDDGFRPFEDRVIACGCGHSAVQVIDFQTSQDSVREVTNLLAGSVIDFQTPRTPTYVYSRAAHRDFVAIYSLVSVAGEA